MPPLPLTKPDLSKFKKAPAPDLSGFKKQKPAFRFALGEAAAPIEPTREEKFAKLQMEAAEAKKESDKANSFGGFAGNFTKEVVKTLAPAPVALGKTIAKISQDPTKIADTAGKLEESQVQLLRLIREKDGRGEDTSKLKRLFNQNADQVDEIKREVKAYANELPTDLEVAGQLGGTALDILSAGTYGKAAAGMKAGQLASNIVPSAVKVVTPITQATGLFSKAGAGRVAQGAGLGYAYDVTSGLSGARGEENKGARAFIPSTGTLIGAALPAALEGEKSVIGAYKTNFTKDGRIAQLEANRLKALQELRQAPLAKAVEKGTERGIDVQKVLSETDVLHGSVDKSGRITTKGDDGAIAQYTQQYVDGNEKLVSEALKKEARSISPETIRAKLTRAIKDSGIEGAELKNALAKIDDEVQGLGIRAGENGTIPLETVHRAKIDKYSDINFNTEAATGKYKKAIAKALKEVVEENTTSVAVKDINKELSKHFAVIDYLTKLDGKTVKGGRLGKYFGQTLGAIVGSHFGPLGAIVGAEAGGQVRGETMARSFRGTTGKVQPQAPAITQAKEFINADPLALPEKSVVPKPVINLPARSQSTRETQEIARIQAQLPQSSNSLGSRQMSQATTIAPTIKPILDTIARHFQEAGDVVNNLPKEEIDRLGGMPALLESTKNNIVMGLMREGKKEGADMVRNLSTAGFASLQDYANALGRVIK